MWNLSTSIIVVAFISRIIPGLLATTISFNSINFEEDLSLNFEEPMDICNSLIHEYVNLDDMGLKVVRDNFISSNTLKSINLEANQIVNISLNAFESVPSLFCLNIRWNNLKNLFDIFLPSFNHTVLTKLNLARTAFKNVLDDFKDLDLLVFRKEIQISSRGLLPSLTHLDISDNNLVEIPKYFESSFPRLTHLYLSDNRLSSSSFHHIPATTQYIYLERNLDNIEFTTFPSGINGLILNNNYLYWNDAPPVDLYPNLRVLSIRNCNDIVNVIQSLEKRKLFDLDISANNLDYIDSELFNNATSLQRFSLDRNCLQSLQFLTPLSSLKDLSIAYNKLIYITADYFSNLKLLTTLNLRGNNIVLFDKDAFSNLKMLQKLDLAENRLIKVPESWMYNLNELYYLNLKSNQFSTIDNMFIHSRSKLNSLYLENNNFTLIEMDSLMRLPSNVEVYLS
ncbi:leucine-rich repeat and immunoglobulin-like domain-containing nogo receptor-interacting protein 1-B [Polistes fuscatus]|uniref:leucine-rich repeat and immunoglobulin-like domain-containing nogo receptor-interacting protein 1-B n=1 Tax=Polistes fuscatus TaxID=30207 RepID=UPI001CA8F274|nr:leucine-rich repeat and immunoglobulin-like domain-containing nogo receptor-interacting protein 1-B [Polistes fuscatus]